MRLEPVISTFAAIVSNHRLSAFIGSPVWSSFAVSMALTDTTALRVMNKQLSTNFN